MDESGFTDPGSLDELASESPEPMIDTDADVMDGAVVDVLDINADGTPETEMVDLDGDDIPEVAMIDTDQDGIDNIAVLDTDGNKIANIALIDADQDAIIEDVVDLSGTPAWNSAGAELMTSGDAGSGDPPIPPVDPGLQSPDPAPQSYGLQTPGPGEPGPGDAGYVPEVKIDPAILPDPNFEPPPPTQGAAGHADDPSAASAELDAQRAEAAQEAGEAEARRAQSEMERENDKYSYGNPYDDPV